MNIDFDDEFASPADYAKIYRSIGMQVVPANFPGEVKEWKRPHYDLKWKQYQKSLMSDEEFNSLFGPGSRYASRSNMGIITGVSPRRIVVVEKARCQALGMQIAAGVPLQCDEGPEYRSFRLGLFGLDKLYDVDASVARLEQALDQVLAA